MSSEKGALSLNAVVSGLLRSLREAKQMGDLESAKLLDIYKKDQVLSSFTVPAFTISEVDIELKFSIEGAIQEDERDKVLDLKVNISPETLKDLEPHQVNVIKLKISPVNLRVFEENK